MSDQADELRQLMRQQSAAKSHRTGPELIVVSGGKGGVGTTYCAVSLAQSLAQAGKRVVLVDADLNHADATRLCGVHDGKSIEDVLSGLCSAREAIQQTLSGLQLLPGIWASNHLVDCTRTNHDCLVAGLRGLEGVAEIVILDTGSGLTDSARRFWAAADQILVVVTADSDSVMDAYAAIKVLAPGEPRASIRLIANQCDTLQAAEVHRRIGGACQRFLALKCDLAGHVPVSLERMDHSGGSVIIPSTVDHSPETASALRDLASSIDSNSASGDAPWAESPTQKRRDASFASVR